MAVADWFTVARAAAAPFVVLLFEWNFPNHDYWATALFAVAMATDWFDGQLARRSGRVRPGLTARSHGGQAARSLRPDRPRRPGHLRGLDRRGDRRPGAARLGAQARGSRAREVLQARLGKLKTWAQALAALLGGLAAAGAVDQTVAWWALLVALVLTWLSGLDYARLAPSLLREPAPAAGAEAGAESTFSSNPASRRRSHRAKRPGAGRAPSCRARPVALAVPAAKAQASRRIPPPEPKGAGRIRR